MDASANCKKCLYRKGKRCTEESEEIRTKINQPTAKDIAKIKTLELRVCALRQEIKNLNDKIVALDTTETLISHPLRSDVDIEFCGYILDISGNWE